MRQAEEDFLVLAAQRGDKKAFHLIFEQYQKGILCYAFNFCRDAGVSKVVPKCIRKASVQRPYEREGF